MHPGMVGPGKHGPSSPFGSFARSGVSKWPISSDAETFTVWTLQPAQVDGSPLITGREVEYIGRYVYGSPLHVKFTGSQRMCRKPFAALATMNPVWCVVRSSIRFSNPARV